MKLREYVEELQKVLTERGNLEVIYAVDDEGNDYGKVYYGATPGCYSDANGERE
jgi:hypothetical protein